MSDKSGQERLARAVILQSLRDLGRGDADRIAEIKEYLFSPLFDYDLQVSGYPFELRDTLLEAVVVSGVERFVICRNTLNLLEPMPSKNMPDKKEPPKEGVRFQPSNQ